MSSKNESDKSIEDMSPEEIVELQKKSCIFCKIANKEIPAKIIHEDENIICILDINPASEGHVLVYPKKHYMILPHLPQDLLSKLFSNVKYISNMLLKSMQSGGTSIFIANGSAAGQRAPHVLVHVFPRKENDKLLTLPKYEMNNESIEKLKTDLGKYFNHVLGNESENSKTEKPVKKHSEKEHIEKNDDKKIDKHKDDEYKDDNEDTNSSNNESKIKSDKDKSKNSKKDSESKNNKISLDDIGKLFG